MHSLALQMDTVLRELLVSISYESLVLKVVTFIAENKLGKLSIPFIHFEIWLGLTQYSLTISVAIALC